MPDASDRVRQSSQSDMNARLSSGMLNGRAPKQRSSAVHSWAVDQVPLQVFDMHMVTSLKYQSTMYMLLYIHAAG